VLTYETPPHALRREPHGDLLRQAYLLTGDPERARELANRAAGSVGAYADWLGPAEALERAKAELVRSYVADPGPPRAAVTGPAPHPDVAMWRAVCRLAPRRRAAIVLRYDEGLSEEQTATRMNTTPRLLRADVDAAMLTLRTAVPDVSDPWMRVADALAAAGRGWSDYTRPAASRVAEVLSAPAPTPAPRPAHGATRAPRSRSARSVALVAGAVAALLLAAAVIVPRLGRDDPAPVQPAPVAAASGESVRGGPQQKAVPAIDVPKGLLNWPARGALDADPTLVAAATSAWAAGVPAAEAPASGVGVLWAGILDRRTVAVVQGLDKAGRPHLAQVAGATPDRLRLQHAEPLHGGTQVLTLLPPAPSGPVRVLVSPEAQVADGLLASNPMDGKPLQHMVLGPDGVSGILPSPPGAPTCSRVVLLGLDRSTPPTGGVNVLYSGIMSADMLGGMPGKVEVGSSTLAPSADATPDTPWFADGAKLAPKVLGTGTLTVAALGPRLPARPLDAADRRMVSSRAYELHRGGDLWVGSVVDVDGKTVCASAMPVTARTGPTAWALRCPIPGKMMPGIVHVVGVTGADSVDVSLQPTKSPEGQEKFAATATRPDNQPTDHAFAAITVAPMGFPCGVGTLQVHSGRSVTTVSLPVYTP
jgi:Sigma-70, region 4